MQPETKLTRSIRIALVKTGRVRVVPNKIVANAYVKTPKGDFVPVGWCGGPEGSPDLWGFLRGGRVFAIETKTATGRTRDRQKLWHAAARKWGAFVAVARSVEDALEALERAEQGACE